MSYPLTDIDGIDEHVAVLLKSAGIRSSESLLEKTCSLAGRRTVAEQTGLCPKQILCWANIADRMRVKGVRKEHARLLEAAGVVTVRELTHRNPKKLAEAMAAANAKRKLVRALPSEKAVTRWIASARALQAKISY